MKERRFYRMAKGLEDGFWYNKDGVKLENPIFDMPMDYDENHLGFISVCGSLKELVQYFKLINVLKFVLLRGYKVYSIKTNAYKFYNGYYMIDEMVYYESIRRK